MSGLFVLAQDEDCVLYIASGTLSAEERAKALQAALAAQSTDAAAGYAVAVGPTPDGES